MPGRNTVREFVSDGYYHVYNRGVEKRNIFLDLQDYNVFLTYLATYLMPKDTDNLQVMLASSKIPWSEKDKIIKLLNLKNFTDEITLITFCLMPNHFHFLIKQKDERIVNEFMKSLCVRYAMYTKGKYKRVGSLFQGVYRSVRILTDEQLIYASRYIHRNPLPLLQGLTLQTLEQYKFSSYPQYLGIVNHSWIKPPEILRFFSGNNKTLSYREFVTKSDNDSTVITESAFAIDE